LEQSTDLQDQGGIEVTRAIVARADGDHAGALRHATKAMEGQAIFGMGQDFIREAFVELLDAALVLGDLDTAQARIDAVKALRSIEVPVYVRAHLARFEARIAGARGSGEVESKFREAATMFRELGTPFQLGITLTEWAEWLVDQARQEEARPFLEESAVIFDKLGAVPWAGRAARAAALV
jgi:ATP/maltotriose-dependent transcriptional regulator MalT